MDTDNCERCGDSLPGTGHYVELECPGDDGFERIAGCICDDCADELASEFPESAKIQGETVT